MEYNCQRCEHVSTNLASATEHEKKCKNIPESVKQLEEEAIMMTTSWAERTWMMHSESRSEERLTTCQDIHDEEAAWRLKLERNPDTDYAATERKDSIAARVESFKKFRLKRMLKMMHGSEHPKNERTKELRTYAAQRWDIKEGSNCAICQNIPKLGKRMTKLKSCYKSKCQACSESHFIKCLRFPYCNSETPHLNFGTKAPWTKRN